LCVSFFFIGKKYQTAIHEKKNCLWFLSFKNTKKNEKVFLFFIFKKKRKRQ
jgi:hypothetical protein